MTAYKNRDSDFSVVCVIIGMLHILSGSSTLKSILIQLLSSFGHVTKSSKFFSVVRDIIGGTCCGGFCFTQSEVHAVHLLSASG